MTNPSDTPPPRPTRGSLPASEAITQDGLPETIGPYRFEDRLGRGGMGVVYSAWDERLRRRVALKQVLPERAERPRARERFLREARAAAQLNHPNIVHVYDILETPGGDWIVMELVEGQSLRRLIQSGPLEPRRAVLLAEQVAGGLAAAHALGIVHRDLKTENVLVTPEGRAKVLDFGLAKHRTPREEDPTLSLDGQLLGTARAMSPEQAGGRELDGRSDLFSLGTLLYEILTGHSPFQASNDFLTMNRVCLHRQVPARELVPGVPPELSRLVDSLLEKDPAHRPNGAAEVAATLALLGRSFEALPPSDEVSDRRAAELRSDPTPTDMMLERRATTRASELTSRQSVERRRITVLCGSLTSATGDSAGGDETATRSSSSLDPEALYELLPAFQERAKKVIGRFDGHLENASGHRLVVCFGYPRAHGDDARRAVLAALELTSEVERLAAEHGSERLSLRVGIHTGPAVASGRGRQARVILGETLDLAHAIESQAPPNATLVSASTRPLIEEIFGLEALESVRLLAGAEPEVLHRVSARLPDDGRSATAELPPMVARERELGLLLECWERTRQGSGQVVLVSGDAGIGKSRLVRALAERLDETSERWLAAHGSLYARTSPFHAVGKLLRHAAGLDSETPPEQQRRRLEQVLERHGLPAGEALAVLAPLASLPPAAGRDDAEPPPEKSRELILRAVPALLLAMAERRPTALLIEDLQWVDPSTLEMLGHLIDRLTAVPMLLLLTFRRHFEAPWGHRSDSSQLTLDRLSEAHVLRLIDQVAKGRELPPEVRQQIVAKTDGVPLFVEELTKTVLASDLLVETEGGFELARPLGALAIPTTLEDSLTARLDRLGGAREVAQIAAVCGREFSIDLLSAASLLPEAALSRELDRLVRAELLLRKGVSAPARYLFKQAMIRDAAYDSLLRRQRQEIHGRLAEALASRFPEVEANRPELLAHHFSQARQLDRAVDYWRRAGEQAFRRSASIEAAAHLKGGLALLAEAPAGGDRDGRELGLQMLLGSALASSSGYGAPEVSEAFDRAFELCGRLPDSPDLFWVVWGLFRFHLARASFARTGELAERLERLAEAQDEATLAMAASWASGFSRFFVGELRAAHEDLERVMASESPERPRQDANLAGEDFGVNAATFDPVVLWYLGHPDQARLRGEESLERARRAGHPLSLCLGLNHTILLHMLRRDPAKVIARSEELLALSSELGAWWQAWAEMYLGWAHSMSADPGAAPASDSSSKADWELEQIRHGLAGFRAGGSRLFEPHFLYRLAEVHLRCGELAEAEQALTDGLAIVEETGQRIDEAETCRLLAEVEVASPEGTPEKAEQWLRRAVAAARRQRARSLELRAATRLSRLWAEQGREKEARDLLEPVYGGFTEGFETPDLADARTALDALLEPLKLDSRR